MGKQKGTPVYTQHTVAWPELPLRERMLDEVGVSFEAKGGGTYASLDFRWHKLSTYEFGALRVECFSDGFGALLDPRIVSVIESLKRMRMDDRDVSPAKLIELLEAQGVTPSLYHLKGMIESGEHDSPEAKEKLQAMLDRRRRWEVG